MNLLQVGFGRQDITPPLGTPLKGNNNVRLANKILDPLEVNVLALACGEEKLLLIATDTLHSYEDEAVREAVSQATGVPQEAILAHGTHVHTGPEVDLASPDPEVVNYSKMFIRKIASAAQLALDDLAPAKMGYAVSNAPNVAFIRRFRMKDGSIATNPGINNPNIDCALGEPDTRVNVLRFDREDGKTYVLANFGCHPDTTNRQNITADWPGVFRRATEKALENVKCIFFTGAQGDVNHLDVHPAFDTGWDGYDYRNAIHLGHTVAGAVLQVFHKVRYQEVASLRYSQEVIQVATARPAPEQLPEAHRIMDIYNQFGAKALPLSGSARATIISEARRMVTLENGPDFYPIRISAVAIGNVAMVGLPCEPFTALGLALKKAPGWDLVLPCCLTNGSWGYVAMKENYAEGAYETRGSRLKAGCGEQMIETGLRLLEKLH